MGNIENRASAVREYREWFNTYRPVLMEHEYQLARDGLESLEQRHLQSIAEVVEKVRWISLEAAANPNYVLRAEEGGNLWDDFLDYLSLNLTEDEEQEIERLINKILKPKYGEMVALYRLCKVREDKDDLSQSNYTHLYDAIASKVKEILCRDCSKQVRIRLAKAATEQLVRSHLQENKQQ